MRRRPFHTGDGAVSPVVGVILVVAITVLLASVVSTMVFNVAGETDESVPQASFSFETEAGHVTVVHEGGETIDGDRLKFGGVATDKTSTGAIPEWSDEEVAAGESATVPTKEGELEVVWVSDGGARGHVIASESVPKTELDDPICSIQLRDARLYANNVIVETGGFANRDSMYMVVSLGGSEKYSGYVGESESVAPFAANLFKGDTVRVKLYETGSRNSLIYEKSETVAFSNNDHYYCN